ncbi:hypothetical protein HYFRA_00001693 [Hymenoscyphus fraxineus]|uniref:Uncharacterized protein n=1 Tax=Hymenoscyphus fraxineus TaxID=746836 RepID=A0A9N9L4C1_9HELO|nr:hypothetical protein HYFRA_00001693 [Hymenoscyphus fraxineus]
MADENDPRLRNESFPLTGNDLLTKFCEDAAKTGQKLTLLLISSLEDIYNFLISNKLLIKKLISNLEVLPEANNNRYDIEAATNFYALIVVAVAATIEPEIFAELAKTGNENIQKAQDLSFYRNAFHEDPAKRFRLDRDREYFLRTRTNWFDNHSDTDPRPKGVEISAFTKVVVYNALAAIGVSGEDSLKALNVLNIQPDSIASDSEQVRALKRRHKVVGYEIKRIVDGKEVLESEVPGINVEQMVNSLKAFLKGSLISAPLLGSKETDGSPGAPERPRIR